MIMLLALPIIAAVALAHRYLRLYAPSNLPIRRVRASWPTMSTFAAMLTVAAGLIVGTKVLSDAVAAGAPGWLNLVVLVLAWDAIKIGSIAITVPARRALLAVKTTDGRPVSQDSRGIRTVSSWPCLQTDPPGGVTPIQ